MKIRKIFGLFCLLAVFNCGYAQVEYPSGDSNPMPGSSLPSEETSAELDHLSSRPSLRYGPGGSTLPNKETPLPIGDVSGWIFLGLVSTSLIYAIKTKKKRNEN